MDVGIIIPAYNSQKTIISTLNSVSNLKKKVKLINFYPVLIDDGSSDKTYSIAEIFKKKKVLYKLIKLNKNKGISNARNVGIRYLRDKDFLIFLDSDDKINYRFFLKKNIFKKNTIYISSYLEKTNKIKKRVNFFNKDKKFKKNQILNYLKLYLKKPNKHKMVSYVWGKIYPCKIIKKYKIRFKNNLVIAEDLEFNLNIFNKINNLYYKKELLYEYNNNLNNKNIYSNSIGSLKKLKKIFNSILLLDIKKHFNLKNNFFLFNHCKTILFLINVIKSCSLISSKQKKKIFLNNLKIIFSNQKARSVIKCYNIELAKGNKILGQNLKNFNAKEFLNEAKQIYKKRYPKNS